MKFIKTVDDGYIRTDRINNLYVLINDTSNLDRYGAANVMAVDDNNRVYRLKIYSRDPKSTTQFDPQEAAQAWLDNLVSELSKED